jgi:O-acetyl-ADP-ribose deacetylase (regulator of RNase III)
MENVNMKHGDWICPNCNKINFARRDKCFECGTSKPGNIIVEMKSGDWKCPDCNEINFARRAFCFKCNAPRPSQDRTSQKQGDWFCSNYNELNFASRETFYKCNHPKSQQNTNKKIEIIIGDITKQNVDAIVNAANKSLLGGGGVDGAIHKAAGFELLNECRILNGCETGQAKITKGYNLPARYVIHTVGPIWNGGQNNENEQLANCYKNSLRLAVENNITSIAFPSISTGVYGFPIERASEIALNEIINFIKTDSSIENIKIICYGNKPYEIYNEKYNQLSKE